MIPISDRLMSLLGIILISLFTSLFVFFIIWSTIDFPFQDDVDYIRFIYLIKTEGGNFSNYLVLFFQLANDHFVLVLRLIFIVFYSIFGYLPIDGLIYFNIVQLLLIQYLFYLEFKKLKLNILFFLPVIVLNFQPQYFEVSTWASGGLCHITTSLLIFLAVKLSITRKYFSTYLFTVLSTLTFGSGLFAISSVGLSYFLQKKYKPILILVFLLIIYLIIYKINYSPSGRMAELSTNFYNIFVTFFGLMGGVFSVFDKNGIFLSVGAGIFAFSAFVFLSFKSFFRSSSIPSERIVLLSYFSYMAAAIFLIAFVRSSTGTVIVGRFIMFSPLLLTCLYILMIPHFFNSKWMFASLLFISLSFSALSYYKYTQVVYNRRNLASADTFNWSNNHAMFNMVPQFVLLANEFLIPAYQLGIWKVNETYFPKEKLETKSKAINLKISNYPQHHLSKDNYFLFQLDAFPFKPSINKAWFILFKNKSSGKKFTSPVKFYKNGKLNFIKTGNYLAPSGLFEIQTQQMTSGTFDMYLLGDQNFKINKTLEISLAKNSAIMK